MRPNTKLKIYLKTLWVFLVITCHSVFNMWLETTLLTVWPEDTKRLDTLIMGCVMILGICTLPKLPVSPSLSYISYLQNYLYPSLPLVAVLFTCCFLQQASF